MKQRIFITLIGLALLSPIATSKYSSPPTSPVSPPEPAETLEAVEVVKDTQPKEKLNTEPVAKPQPVVRSGNCSLVNNYDWPKNIAYGVCMAESGGNHQATNWNDNHGQCVGSYGLMQIGCFWFPYFGYSLDQAHDAQVNMDVAYKIWARSGFQPWTTYTKGLYLKYL